MSEIITDWNVGDKFCIYDLDVRNHTIEFVENVLKAFPNQSDMLHHIFTVSEITEKRKDVIFKTSHNNIEFMFSIHEITKILNKTDLDTVITMTPMVVWINDQDTAGNVKILRQRGQFFDKTDTDLCFFSHEGNGIYDIPFDILNRFGLMEDFQR